MRRLVDEVRYNRKGNRVRLIMDAASLDAPLGATQRDDGCGGRRHSSISDATRAVQPVWCEAPRPSPLSPWKYS